MKLKKIWIWSAIIAAVVLTILGMYGEDLSLLKRNEKTEETSYAYESGNTGNSDSKAEVEKVYDAGMYLRSKPLKDPFHSEGIAKIDAEMKNGMNVKNTQTANLKYEHKERKNTPVPDLYGVAALGNSRKALLSYGSNTINAKEGDRVGDWTVVSIGDKTVELANNSERKILELK